MANNRFQFKRTSTSGLLPNTTNSANNSYIAAGEFAVNLTDKKVVSSDGSTIFEVGANVINQTVTGTLNVNAISASGTLGANGYVLTTNGTASYWAPSGLTAGDGLDSNTTHYFVRANTGIIANTTGTFVDPTYIATLGANNATYLGGVTLTTLQDQITGNSATAYTNATVFASNASNINSGTLAFARLPANIAFWSNTNIFTAPQTFNANVIIAGNTTSQLTIGTATDGIDANSTVISVGNATVFTTVNSTSFSGTANNATNLGGSSLATIQGQITGNAATAYTNAITYSSNATNLSSGTVNPARLGSGTANSTTVLYGNGVWAAVGGSSVSANTILSTGTGANQSFVLSTSTATSNDLIVTVNGLRYSPNNYQVTGSTLYLTAPANSEIVIQLAGGPSGAQGPAGSIDTSAAYTWSNVQTFNANVILSGNSTSQLLIGGTTVESQITGNAATAYSNAVANASALYLPKSGGTMTGNLTVTTSIFDGAGNVRDLPVTGKAAVYQLAATDTGEVISTTANVTVNGAVLSTNQAFSIFNNSASAITIISGAGATMYLAGTATTGNRTLAQRGVATVLMVASNTFVISGAGIT